MPEFVDEPIEVEPSAQPGPPKALIWRGKRLEVRRVINWWHDFSYGPYRYLPKRWWLRRRRLYFDLELADGRKVRIYRNFRRNEWILLCFLEGEAEGEKEK